MKQSSRTASFDELPFFLPYPGQTDVVFILVAIGLILIVLGLGALYFTIQAWPERLAAGTSKVQLQLIGLLGLISLVTMNNIYWIAALLLAAVRIPDIVTPIRKISRSLAELPAAVRDPDILTSLREISKSLADRRLEKD